MKWFFGAMAAMQVVQFARSNPMLVGMAAVAAMAFAGYKLTDYYQKSGGEPMILGTLGHLIPMKIRCSYCRISRSRPNSHAPPPSAAPSGGYSWRRDAAEFFPPHVRPPTA